jgi:hypothetical protein
VERKQRKQLWLIKKECGKLKNVEGSSCGLLRGIVKNYKKSGEY